MSESGVKERLADARELWSSGRKGGAFIFVLIACAATSRKRYPRDTRNPLTGRPYTDREAFERFIIDEMEIITSGPRYGVRLPFGKIGNVPLPEILYNHLRCQAIHEATLNGVQMIPPETNNEGRFAVVKLEDPLGFPEHWVETLATVAWLASDNDDEFADDSMRKHAQKQTMAERVTTDPQSFYYQKVSP